MENCGTSGGRGNFAKEIAMTTTLFVLNDPPYGTERSYNGLRLAGSLARREGEHVRVFLLGDAASCAKRGQVVPQGYYNLELMLGSVTRRGERWEFAAHVWMPADLPNPNWPTDVAAVPSRS
jgi:hypothetical protein